MRARNKGLSLATGDWIQFLDADDLLLPEKIGHQVELLASGADMAFVAGSYSRRKLDGTEIKVTETDVDPFRASFLNKAGITSSNLWSRRWLNKVQGWKVSLKSSQEADLMMRLVFAGGQLIPDPVPLTVIRERESGQISQRDPSLKWKQFIEVRLSYLSALKAQWPDVYKEHLPLFFDFLMVSILTLARYDKEAADHYYNSYIRSSWRSANAYGFTPFKVFLLKMIGIKKFSCIGSR